MLISTGYVKIFWVHMTPAIQICCADSLIIPWPKQERSASMIEMFYFCGWSVYLLGLGRISGSAGLSGRISGYPARKTRISGIWQKNPAQPYLKAVTGLYPSSKCSPLSCSRWSRRSRTYRPPSPPCTPRNRNQVLADIASEKKVGES